MPSQKRRLAQLTCDKQKIAKQSGSDRSSTQIHFQLRYIQTSSRNAVNKKLFLTSLLLLGRSYRDVQHTNFRMSLKIKIVRQ
jgi:hypothetical protein